MAFMVKTLEVVRNNLSLACTYPIYVFIIQILCFYVVINDFVVDIQVCSLFPIVYLICGLNSFVNALDIQEVCNIIPVSLGSTSTL